MKKLTLSLVALMFLGGISFAGGKAARTFTGEIMDSACAKAGNHDAGFKMTSTSTAKDCTLACVKTGAKFVLYNPTKKIAYELDDQEKPKDFAGQQVKVIGTYNSASKTIHVEKVEAAS